MINPIVKTIELPDGRTITLETGKLAKQADGSVMLRMGNTMLLATVCAAKDAVPGTDFMPLQVEYKEKFAAFGRFPGGFTKREGRASDYEILTCRLVDRALRPLFPDNYHAEVYVNIILFSADGVDMPDALAGLAASAALAVSDIPFNGPISEVRVARINGEFVINPTVEQAKVSLLLACLRKIILLIPLIFILPHVLPDAVFGVFLAEPVSDILAATITTITFFARFDKILDRGAAHV